MRQTKKQRDQQRNDIINAMMAFCMKHKQPIPRTQMQEVFHLTKAEIKQMEKDKLIEQDYFCKKVAKGNSPWISVYYPAGYKEKFQQEQDAALQQVERDIKDKWNSTNRIIRLAHKILIKIGTKTTLKLANKIYVKHTADNFLTIELGTIKKLEEKRYIPK